MSNLFSTKNPGWPVRPRRENHKFFIADSKLGSINKNLLFLSPLPALHDVRPKEINKLELIQGLYFKFIDLVKNNGTEYLLIFVDSCEEICNSKAVADIATTGKHRGMNSIQIRPNLFHQRKLRQDVEPQNTHTVHF